MNETNAQTFFSSPWFIVIVVLEALIILGIIFRIVYRRMCRTLIDRVEYRREFSDEGVYEGDSVTLTETIYNNSSLPLLFVYAESYFFPGLELDGNEGGKGDEMQLFQSRFRLIMPYMQIRRKHRINCRLRGRYKLESAEIFLPGTSRYTESRSCLYVYPRILAAPTTPAPAGILMGESVSRRMLVRNPFTITGVRPYAFGDPFNQINFKATARAYATAAEPLRVNARDFCSNRTFMVYINFQCDPNNPIPSDIFNAIAEASMSYTADIIRVALENGYRLGLRTNSTSYNGDVGLDFPMESGELHTTQMLHALSEARVASSFSFSQIIAKDIANGLADTEIFVFTSYTDEEIDICLAALEKNRNTVNLIIPSVKEYEDEDE